MSELEVSKPEGCQAAVVFNDERTDTGGFFNDTNTRFTAKIVCGVRSEDLEKDYEDSRILFPENRVNAANEITDNVNLVLGAMCLGCPHRLSPDTTTSAD